MESIGAVIINGPRVEKGNGHGLHHAESLKKHEREA
jgi:hypothetical protein